MSRADLCTFYSRGMNQRLSHPDVQDFYDWDGWGLPDWRDQEEALAAAEAEDMLQKPTREARWKQHVLATEAPTSVLQEYREQTDASVRRRVESRKARIAKAKRALEIQEKVKLARAARKADMARKVLVMMEGRPVFVEHAPPPKPAAPEWERHAEGVDLIARVKPVRMKKVLVIRDGRAVWLPPDQVEGWELGEAAQQAALDLRKRMM